MDYLVRQKHVGANLNFFKLEQAPVPPPEAYDVPVAWAPGTTLGAWVLERFATAVVWHDDLGGLAVELAAAGVPEVPVAVPDVAARRRARALAELDAAHALMFGWDRRDLAHVLSTFGALRAQEERVEGRWGTASRVLAAYDRLTGGATTGGATTGA